MKIEGAIADSGVRLVALDEPDATGPYLRWMQDPETLRFLEARFVQHSSQTLSRYIATMNADPNSALFGICVAPASRHVGNIKLGPINCVHRHAEIGLMIGEREIHGQGVGSRAIRLLSAWAFETLDLNKLTAGCYATNVGSARAFEKAGFSIEAVKKKHLWDDPVGWVDAIEFGLLRDDATALADSSAA